MELDRHALTQRGHQRSARFETPAFLLGDQTLAENMLRILWPTSPSLLWMTPTPYPRQD